MAVAAGAPEVFVFLLGALRARGEGRDGDGGGDDYGNANGNEDDGNGDGDSNDYGDADGNGDANGNGWWRQGWCGGGLGEGVGEGGSEGGGDRGEVAERDRGDGARTPVPLVSNSVGRARAGDGVGLRRGDRALTRTMWMRRRGCDGMARLDHRAANARRVEFGLETMHVSVRAS